MARLSRPSTIGTAGQHYVMGAFAEIGWGPASNAESDAGTDLWVQATDERSYLLRRNVGVQVKTGPSYFRFRDEVNGETGWWYGESDPDHFDDWLDHTTPHLIVLHDLETHVSYWAHVTREAVRPAGVGRKIFVPEHQTIDAEHEESLRDVALSRDVPLSFEGSAVGPSPEMVPAGCELRYALIASWLVAPHSNSEGSISSAEGVALLVEGRFRGLRNRSDRNEDVPDPADPDAAVEWGWRFVAAIWDWAQTDATSLLENVFESAPDTRSAAASGIFVACALARLGRHRDAVDVLTPLAGDDEMDSVDQAWVLVQRARASAELGELRECRADAAHASDLLAGHGDDITASAITAAAAWQQYMTAPAGDIDHLADYLAVTAAMDNSVSRRRWPRVGWGLNNAVDAGFRQWAQELTITIGGSPDHGATELFGAEVCADLAGDHSAWETFTSLRARLRIQHAAGSSNETNELTEGLDALLRTSARN